jgi:hypothetical protein
MNFNQQEIVKWAPKVFVGILILGGLYEVIVYLGGLGKYDYPVTFVSHQSNQIAGKPVYEAQVKLNGWDAGDTDLSALAPDIQDVVKHELGDGISDQSMLFHIVGDAGGGYDDYGHARPTALVGAFDLEYSMDDLKRIDWDHTTEFSFFNLAHVTNVNSAGEKVGKAYCEKNRDSAHAFCDAFP